MKKICDVLIRNWKYELLSIPNKTHMSSRGKSTLWIKNDKDFFDEKDDYIPWDDSFANRKSWEIIIKQGNSIQLKQDAWEINGHTNVHIFCNSVQVYEFPTYDLNSAFLQSQNIIEKLKSIPINIDNLEEGVGRCIFYKRLPCKIVSRFINGNMIIRPDCDKKDLDDWWDNFADPWYSELQYELLEEWREDNNVTVDILSENIHWYRNDREIKINNINRKIKKGT